MLPDQAMLEEIHVNSKHPARNAPRRIGIGPRAFMGGGIGMATGRRPKLREPKSSNFRKIFPL